MEKRKNIKTRRKKILLIVIWIGSISFLFVGTYFFLWLSMHQAKPDNQPKYSTKEESYFKKLEKRHAWKDPDRYIYNVNEKGETLPDDFVSLNKSYVYSLSIKIEDSTTFYSLPSKAEDTIALHLYNYVIDRTPKLRKIVVDFSHVERLGDGASIGHSRTEEYEVHGKQLIKLKQAIK